MNGTCDVPGCTNRTYMGWRPLTQRIGKQICKDHWCRHKDPQDSFDLFEAFNFRGSAGIRRAASRKGDPSGGPEPDRRRVVCMKSAANPGPRRKEPDCHEPEKPSACKACGAERAAGHTFCSRCSRERKAKSNRERRMRAYRKSRKCSAFVPESEGACP
jgi:hypothetical protein